MGYGGEERNRRKASPEGAGMRGRKEGAGIVGIVI